MSEVVGVGIFLTPAAMMRGLGGTWGPITVWLVMGGFTAAGALCYAELATRLPCAGGAYVFLREGFGRRSAFVYGLMAMFVMDPGITAALGLGLAQYLLAAVGGPSHLARWVAIACIAAFGLLTTAGLGPTGRVLRWLAGLKLVIVGVLVVIGLVRVWAGTGLHASRPVPWSAGAVATSAIAAFFAFGGWWDLGRMGEEVETPRRTMPIALIGGVALVTAMYVLVTLAFVLVGSAASAGSDEAFVSDVGRALFGQSAGRVLAAMVVVTVAGSLAAVLLGAPRTYLAMARDGLLPPRLRWFDVERHSSPVGTCVQATLACVLVLLGSFEQILGYFVPAAVLFLGLSAASLFRIDRREGGESVFRAPLFPVPLVLFLVLITAMLVLFAVGTPLETALGGLVVAAGVLLARRFVR